MLLHLHITFYSDFDNIHEGSGFVISLLGYSVLFFFKYVGVGSQVCNNFVINNHPPSPASTLQPIVDRKQGYYY